MYTRRHLFHVIFFLTVILLFEISTGGIRLWHFPFEDIEPIQQYGWPLTVVLYLFRLLSVLPLPLCVCHALGLIFFETFPFRSALRGSQLLAPFVTVRIVTRGDYPGLVRNNVERNLKLCLDEGLDKFMIEVVTDKPVALRQHSRVREVVVPRSYKTKSGAMFKARALQYCLEDDVNILNDDEWIVHLDEETLLTPGAIRGILNFIMDGKDPIGQGLITYANEQVINWVTTLADSFRVGADMGMVRFQFRVFRRALFLFKGSFVICQAGVERRVGFDNGVEGSIAEDTYFAMQALTQGYTFGWVEGEMWEKSPFSLWDFLQQRKRWMQGIYLVVHDNRLAFRSRACLALALYSWLTLPLTTSNVILSVLFPIPVGQCIDFICGFVGAVNFYLYIFGAMKSFSLRRLGTIRFVLCVLGAIATIPIVVVCENVAVVWGLFGDKRRFYVVNKAMRPEHVV